MEVKDELTERIAARKEAAKGDIEAKAKAAYDAEYTKAMKEVELNEITAYRKEVEAKETQLEKDLSL